MGRFALNRLRVWLDDPKEHALLLGQIAVVAPRLLVHLASIAAVAAVASSCVPVTRYEEAESASQVELASRRRAEATLVELQKKLEAAQAELAARDQKLADSERNLTESKLEGSLVAKERDEQNAIVDQLRGELARAGDHLRYYSDRKSELEQALGNAEKHSEELNRSAEKAALLAKLMRDLSLGLSERVARGKVALDVQDGKVSLGIITDERSGGTPKPEELAAVLDAVIKVVQAYPSVKLELEAPENVKALLVERGVSEDRIQQATPSDADAPSKLEIRFISG